METILSTKKIKYSSNLNGDVLKRKIEDIFEKGTLRLVGKFTSQNEFAAYDKWSVISWYLPNIKRKSAYLKGKILNSEKGTILKLNLRPNTFLSAFPVLSAFLGILIILLTNLNKQNTQSLIIGSVFILAGILYYAIGIFSRNRLQKNFEKNLNIHKISGEN